MVGLAAGSFDREPEGREDGLGQLFTLLGGVWGFLRLRGVLLYKCSEGFYCVWWNAAFCPGCLWGGVWVKYDGFDYLMV